MELKSKSFYAATVAAFEQTPTDQIVGTLSKRIGLLHSGNEREQILAWEEQISLLRKTISLQNRDTSEWGVLIELQLLRIGRRIDTVLLIGDQIACIEFKIGSSQFHSIDIEQTVDYALCLRDFHSGSHGKTITPILCCNQAHDTKCSLDFTTVDAVSTCLKTNSDTLVNAIATIAKQASDSQINYQTYDTSSYNPTPNIVSAARSIYAGHTVQEIGRSDANGDSLQQTAKQLAELATHARENKEHTICFVTGEPGSGKTLLGLDLVFSGEVGRVAHEPAALLSGNRPLVAVLQEAIAIDAKEREGLPKKEAKRQSEQALQNLLGYLKEHDNPDSSPPEHVIVFDEAQRAWDAEVGLKLLQREASEPQLFLEILGRIEWCCLVCLVGPGQEINRGEGGLGLWGQALHNHKGHWCIHVSPQSRNGSKGLVSLLSKDEAASLDIRSNNDLHLVTNLRAYRNDKQGKWVEALLDGDLDSAKEIADTADEPPAYITRDLSEAKRWLKIRQRGGHRVGLLASSSATRLIADGIPPSPRSNELGEVANWFLKPAGDHRSSNALERPLTEFVCQGLEIDYACLCWGNDLNWKEDHWVPRKMFGPKWRTTQKPETIQYQLNAYRVLLTRSRAGMVIYVPIGDLSDPTRQPQELDSIYLHLQISGCAILPTASASLKPKTPPSTEA